VSAPLFLPGSGPTDTCPNTPIHSGHVTLSLDRHADIEPQLDSGVSPASPGQKIEEGYRTR
jgi:hypothetical protein